jgi:hypothetical protein
MCCLLFYYLVHANLLVQVLLVMLIAYYYSVLFTYYLSNRGTLFVGSQVSGHCLSRGLILRVVGRTLKPMQVMEPLQVCTARTRADSMHVSASVSPCYCATHAIDLALQWSLNSISLCHTCSSNSIVYLASFCNTVCKHFCCDVEVTFSLHQSAIPNPPWSPTLKTSSTDAVVVFIQMPRGSATVPGVFVFLVS